MVPNIVISHASRFAFFARIRDSMNKVVIRCPCVKSDFIQQNRVVYTVDNRYLIYIDK